MVRAAILDVDGTLIDSNEAHARAWQEALREKDIEPPFLEIRWRIGMGADRILPELAGIALDSEKGQAIDQRRKQIFRERFLPQCKPFPKVRELLQTMKDEGLKLIVGTSSGGEILQFLLRQAGVDDMIDDTTSKDDVDRSKPEPDIVEAALRKANVRPDEAVMLGDTPYDVAAATRAGIKIVALTCGGWEAEELEPAAAVYRDPAELLRDFGQSLFSRKKRDQPALAETRPDSLLH